MRSDPMLLVHHFSIRFFVCSHEGQARDVVANSNAPLAACEHDGVMGAQCRVCCIHGILVPELVVFQVSQGFFKGVIVALPELQEPLLGVEGERYRG